MQTLHRPIMGILIGGGVAATLDLIYAVTRNWLGGASPLWTLQLVGSGWLGESSFARGVPAGVVVLPLSAFPLKLSYTPARVIEGFVSHAFLVGVPIALAIPRFSGTPAGATT